MQNYLQIAKERLAINRGANIQNTSYTKQGPGFIEDGYWRLASWSPKFLIIDSYKRAMDKLEEKYRGIPYVPLDVPYFDLDKSKFLQLFEHEAIDILRKLPSPDMPIVYNNDYVEPEYRGFHITSHSTLDFNLHDAYVNGRLSQKLISNSSGYEQGRDSYGYYTKKLFKHTFFSKFITQCFETLPILYINNILIVKQLREVYPTHETSMYYDMPTEIRINLFGEHNPFYLSPLHSDKLVYANTPSTTNCYMFNNGSYVHGIEYNKPHYTAIVSCVLSPQKLEILLDRSIGVYV